jgi:hypothetical protein
MCSWSVETDSDCCESTTGQMQFDRAGEDAEEYQLAKTDSIRKAEKLLDKRRQEA